MEIGGLVRIHDVEDAIRHVEGIRDFEEVLMEGKSKNIRTPIHLKPLAGEVYFDGN